MFSSLRGRLWVSYGLLVSIVLIVFAVGLVLAVRRNPQANRALILRIKVAESVAGPRLENVINNPDQLATLIKREATNRNLRLAILRNDGSVVIDSNSASKNPLPSFPLPIQPTLADSNQAPSITASDGKVWIYSITALDAQNFLVVTAQRPNVALRTILRDDLFTPFFRTTLLALLLVFILSIFMSRSISNPLQKVGEAARRVANGEFKPLPLEGPREMRELSQVFNEMIERIKSSQNSQRDFVANVSHELKTPLTSIQGFSQAILDGTARSSEALEQAASVIYNEAGRMNRLVMDLLSLARLEAGTADLQRAPVNIGDLLQSVVDKFALQAQQSQVSLNTNYQPLPTVIGDGDRLAQVFSNLIDNALKFTPAKGTIDVSAIENNGMVLITVADSGSGIPLEDQSRIFERFYQTDKSRRGGANHGIGLGLPIARQIVLAHGGEISVNSIPGHGCIFTVKLPKVRPTDETLNVRKGKI
jgi:two-component system OmpR family sensor kinase